MRTEVNKKPYHVKVTLYYNTISNRDKTFFLSSVKTQTGTSTLSYAN